MKKLMFVLLSVFALFSLFGCDEKTGDPTLSSPQNVTIENGVVTWQSVEGATSYRIVVGTSSFTTTNTTFDLKQVTIPEGSHSVSVIALKDKTVSNPSSSVTYTVTLDTGDLYSRLLKLVNESYEPEMSLSDFNNDPSQYEAYLQMSLMMNSVALSMTQTDLSETDAYNMVKQVYEMPQRMQQTISIRDLMTEINDLSAYGMKSTDFSNVAVNLMMTFIGMNRDRAEHEFQTQSAVYQQQVDAFLLKYPAVDFSSISEIFMPYLTPEQESLFMEFFLPESNVEAKMDFVYYTYSEILNQIEYNYFYDDGNPYFSLFLDVFIQIKASDLTLYNSLKGYDHPMRAYFDYLMDSQDLEYSHSYLTQLETNLAMMTSIIDAISENEVMFKEVFSELSSYLNTFYSSIPESVFDQLANIEMALEISEAILIKNELLDVLITTLPEEETFIKFFTLMDLMAQSVSGVQSNNTETEIAVVAKIERASIDLLLNILVEVTSEDVMAILTLQNDLYETVTIIDEYYQYDEQKIKVDVLFELVSYVLNFLDDSMITHEDKVIYLETLLQSEAFLSLQNKSIELLLQSLENQEMYPPEMVMFLIELSESKDDIIAALDLFKTLGIAFIDEFRLTSGKAIADLILFLDEPQTVIDAAFYEELEAVIFGIREYHEILFSLNSVENIETVLRAIRVPLKASILNSMMLTTDFDVAYERLVPSLASLIYEIAILENDLFASLDQAEIASMINANVWQIEDPELLYSVVFIRVVDNALSLSNKERFLEIITNLFDTLLKDAFILEMTNSTEQSMDEMRLEISNYYSDLFDELDTLALLDFSNMTETERQSVYSFPARMFIFSGGIMPPIEPN